MLKDTISTTKGTDSEIVRLWGVRACAGDVQQRAVYRQLLCTAGTSLAS